MSTCHPCRQQLI